MGATVDDLRSYLREAIERGIQNIVALRGDPPRGETAFVPVDGGLRYANELVALIRAEFAELGVAVAGYPETHQEAPRRGCGPGEPEAEGGRRGRRGDHAALLPQRRFLPLPRAVRGGGDPRADRARHLAGD